MVNPTKSKSNTPVVSNEQYINNLAKEIATLANIIDEINCSPNQVMKK